MSSHSSQQMTIEDVLRMAVDPCESRHRGAETSIAAHKRVVSSKQESYKRIMTLIKARGDFGATSKELAYAMGKQLHAISGRLSEIRAMGWIEKSGEVRNGAAVLRVKL